LGTPPLSTFSVDWLPPSEIGLPKKYKPFGGAPNRSSHRFGGDISGFWACAGMRVRIRWSQAGVLLVAAAGILLALRVVPSLLTPPAPPPLPADVGLPRVEAAPVPRPAPRARAVRNLGRVVSGGGGGRRAEAAEGKASKRQAHRPGARSSTQHKPSAPTRRQDPPATPPVPPPVPAPEPEPSPEASSPSVPTAPPNDGSMEFAPH
jgi:hypothetical protein